MNSLNNPDFRQLAVTHQILNLMESVDAYIDHADHDPRALDVLTEAIGLIDALYVETERLTSSPSFRAGRMSSTVADIDSFKAQGDLFG